MNDRRTFIASGMAVAVTAAVRAQAQAPIETYPIPKHPGRRMLIRGKQIYVDVSGPANAPALVYVHGGPGAGSYDFGMYQRARLSKRLRLIQFDQRGALRSEAVGDSEPFTLNDLVEDTEALRGALNIPRWSVLGHSFGALTTTAYALAYPRSIHRLVFENPTFDITASDRGLLRMIAAEFRRMGQADKEAEALAAASAKDADVRTVWRSFARIGRGLGTKRRLDLYAPALPSGYFFDWMAESGLPQTAWLRGSGKSQETLWEDDRVFHDFRRDFRNIRAAALLIKGRLDHNTSPDQIASFSKDVHRSRVVISDRSGHMTHAEDPDFFADTVTRFVLTGKSRL